jgi:hypothetical protein
MVIRRSLMGNVGAKMVLRAVPDDSLVDDDPQIRTADHNAIVHISVTGRHIFENRFKLEEETGYGLRRSYSAVRFRFRFGDR